MAAVFRMKIHKLPLYGILCDHNEMLQSIYNVFSIFVKFFSCTVHKDHSTQYFTTKKAAIVLLLMSIQDYLLSPNQLFARNFQDILDENFSYRYNTRAPTHHRLKEWLFRLA